jgi:N-acylneuraminate cytidylyltransferase
LSGKNLKELGGKPLYQWAVEAAIESGLFYEIVVSTDAELPDLLQVDGVRLHKRCQELCQDSSTVDEVVWDVVKDRKDIDTICCLYATAAAIDSEDLQIAYDMMRHRRYPRMISVAEYPIHPYYAFDAVDDCQFLRCNLHRVRLAIRQYCDTDIRQYYDTGGFYFIDFDTFARERSLVSSESVGGYRAPQWKAVDVNTQEDFDLLEYYMRKHGRI